MFVVVEIGVDGILGFDFLKDYYCFIDMEFLLLKVGGKWYVLYMEGKIGCCRVILVDDVCILLSCEVVVKCNVLFLIFDKVLELGLIEFLCWFMELDRVLVVWVFVIGEKFVLVRMLNLFD